MNEQTSVIIPDWNEGESIGAVLDAIPLTVDCEVIVVDGGLMDGTIKIAEGRGPQVVGSTKSRLCPPLTHREAAELYEALLLDTLRLVSHKGGFDIAVAVTPLESTDYFERVASQEFFLLPVDCANIGGCLADVSECLLGMGYRKDLALKSDGPILPDEYIDQAVDLLDKVDVVFGPSEDGVYYLVGVRKPQPNLFQGVSWITSKVLGQSLAKCNQMDLEVGLLPKWYDIDTETDIYWLLRDLERVPSARLPHTRRIMGDFDTLRLRT